MLAEFACPGTILYIKSHYYNITSIKKQFNVGMVEQKSTQTRVVGKMTGKMHPTPFFQVTWFQ